MQKNSVPVSTSTARKQGPTNGEDVRRGWRGFLYTSFSTSREFDSNIRVLVCQLHVSNRLPAKYISHLRFIVGSYVMFYLYGNHIDKISIAHLEWIYRVTPTTHRPNLCFVQHERRRDFNSSCPCQVFVKMEFFLQFSQLLCCEIRSTVSHLGCISIWIHFAMIVER